MGCCHSKKPPPRDRALDELGLGPRGNLDRKENAPSYLAGGDPAEKYRTSSPSYSDRSLGTFGGGAGAQDADGSSGEQEDGGVERAPAPAGELEPEQVATAVQPGQGEQSREAEVHVEALAEVEDQRQSGEAEVHVEAPTEVEDQRQSSEAGLQNARPAADGNAADGNAGTEEWPAVPVPGKDDAEDFPPLLASPGGHGADQEPDGGDGGGDAGSDGAYLVVVGSGDLDSQPPPPQPPGAPPPRGGEQPEDASDTETLPPPPLLPTAGAAPEHVARWLPAAMVRTAKVQRAAGQRLGIQIADSGIQHGVRLTWIAEKGPVADTGDRSAHALAAPTPARCACRNGGAAPERRCTNLC